MGEPSLLDRLRGNPSYRLKHTKRTETMTLTEANEIWNACYGDTQEGVDGWDIYTPEQRELAINARNAATFTDWNDVVRIDARRAERDGWETDTWDGRF